MLHKLALAETSVTSGNVTDADGNETGRGCAQRRRSWLSATGGYQIIAESPLDLCDNLPDVWPDERVRDAYCRPDGTIVFELHPLDCDSEYRFDKPLQLVYEPTFADSPFLPDQLSQEIASTSTVSNRFGTTALARPLLVCTPRQHIGGLRCRAARRA